MTFFKNWLGSLSAIGGVGGYMSIYCRILTEWRVLAYAIGAVLALEGTPLFVGSSVPAIAQLLLVISKLGGWVVTVMLMAALLRAFAPRKKPLSYYAQKTGAWLFVSILCGITFMTVLPIVLERLDVYIGDLPYSLIYVASFFWFLLSAVTPVWTYTAATLGQSIVRSACFIWAELPALTLLSAPMWLASHLFFKWFSLVAPDNPSMMIVFALYAPIATFPLFGAVAYWYQKRTGKKAAARVDKSA